jgi:hypothetical protein
MRRPSQLQDIRARQSKKEIIDDFFTKLKQVYDQHTFTASTIYNMDETGTHAHNHMINNVHFVTLL